MAFRMLESFNEVMVVSFVSPSSQGTNLLVGSSIDGYEFSIPLVVAGIDPDSF